MDRGNYPPGSDHQPRGDTPEANQRYRDGWERMFAKDEEILEDFEDTLTNESNEEEDES